MEWMEWQLSVTVTASMKPRRCAGICEFVYTCMICFVALNVMSPKRHEKDMLRLKGLGCWFYLRSRCICQFTADF